DVVSIRIVDECGVVTRPVIAVSRTPVVLPAGGQRGRMEGFDLSFASRLERQVHRHHRHFAGNPEIRVLAVVEARRLIELHVVAVAEGREHLAIEGLGPAVVADGKSSVRDHESHLRIGRGSISLPPRSAAKPFRDAAPRHRRERYKSAGPCAILRAEVAGSATRGTMSIRSASLSATVAPPPGWGRLLSPRYWPTWAGLGVLRSLSLLPYRVQLGIGVVLGTVLRRLPVRFVRIARRNIDLCLPELATAERKRLLNRHFRSLGIALLEIAMAWWWSTERLGTISTVEGMEHVRDALARGRGVILLTAHLTPLEIGGRIVAAATPVNIVYRPTKNEALAHVLRRGRSRNGGHAIRRDDIRSMIAALKNNEVVWYAPDQSYRKKGAEMVSLFGIPCPTNTATSRIARMTGAAVLR